MKKIKYILLLPLIIIPISVKADMAAPMSSYKIRISNDLIIYYLLGALVICLTAIVTLILVNKKNKNKISKKEKSSEIDSQKEKKDETIPIKDDNI